MKERIQKIFQNTSESLDAILLKNSAEPFIDTNFFYATDLEKGLFEGSILIMFPDGSSKIITSELEAESARKSDSEILVFKNAEEYISNLSSALGNVKKLGINYSTILHKDFLNLNKRYKEIKYLDVSDAFLKARMTKDEKEIAKMKKAAEIADKVMQKVPELLYEGIKEYELAAEIDYHMQKYGAEKPAFDTISSFAENTAEPHYTHGEKELKKGDFVLCDFGARYKKYNSDMTRTFVFGKASDKQIKIYNTVLEAQKRGIEAIKTGIEAKTVHETVDSFISGTEFAGKFIHSTGHSLGLDVHDGGVAFSPTSNELLKENMVITVEPGIYINGFGGVRIEDDVLIKNDSVELLTKTDKKLIEIL